MKTHLGIANVSSTFPATVLSTLCVLLLTVTANNLDGQVPSWQPESPVVQQPYQQSIVQPVQQTVVQQPSYPPQESYVPQESNLIVGEVVYGNEPANNITPGSSPQAIDMQDFETAPGEYSPEGYKNAPSPALSPNAPSPVAPSPVAPSPVAPSIAIAGRNTSDPNIANEIIRSLEDELFKSHAQAVELYSRIEFLQNQLTTSPGQPDSATKSDIDPNTKNDDKPVAAKAEADQELVNALTLARQQNSALRAELEKRTENIDQQKQALSREPENQSNDERAALKQQYERRIEEARSEITMLQQKMETEQVARNQQISQLESQLTNARASYESKTRELQETAELQRQQDTKRAAQAQRIVQLESQLTDVQTKMDGNENALLKTLEVRRQQDAQRAAQAQKITQLETQLTDVRTKMSAKDDSMLKSAELQRQQDAKRAEQAQQIAQLEIQLTDVRSKMNAKANALNEATKTHQRQDNKRAQEISQLRSQLIEVQISYQEKIKDLQTKDSPASGENPFKRVTENKPNAEASDAPDQNDAFFEEALLKMQQLHDKMFEEIDAGTKRISERFGNRIKRLDPSAAGFEAEKTRLNRDQRRLIREEELKIRQRWQKKFDSHMESTLETV